MSNIKVGVIGIGNMGSIHADRLSKGIFDNAELVAICDNDPERLEEAKVKYPDALFFDNADGLIDSGKVEAVVIATPHYFHPEIAIKAFKKGLHVLSEKPAGVYTKQIREMNEEAMKTDVVFSLMFNQRTRNDYSKAKELVVAGELGEIRRFNWIITDWFRTQAYFNSGGWRATWAGEGGGVLTNQCPHQIDLIQWICGMPNKVRAFCSEGKYHNIEVEDDVTAYLEYDNGATGVFITSTGDYPGTNRFEITGTKGKLLIEDGKVTFYRLRKDIDDSIMNDKKGFGDPEVWECKIPVKDSEVGHIVVLKNWISAIKDKTELICPGIEGINGVELSNSMYLSSWLGETVELPIDENLYYEKLQAKIKNSTYKKTVVKQKVDLAGTY